MKTIIKMTIVTATAILTVLIAQAASTVTFDNQSGRPALVKLIGPTTTSVSVEDGKQQTVTAAPGRYTMKARYGATGSYTYSKGQDFDVAETPTSSSKTTITLHKVVGGNYGTREITEKQFASDGDPEALPGHASPASTNEIAKTSTNDPTNRIWPVTTYSGGATTDLFGKDMAESAGALQMGMDQDGLTEMFRLMGKVSGTDTAQSIAASSQMRYLKRAFVFDQDGKAGIYRPMVDALKKNDVPDFNRQANKLGAFDLLTDALRTGMKAEDMSKMAAFVNQVKGATNAAAQKKPLEEMQKLLDGHATKAISPTFVRGSPPTSPDAVKEVAPVPKLLKQPLAIEKFLSWTRDQVRRDLGKPDREGNNFDSFFAVGIVVHYDDAAKAVKIEATEFRSGDRFKGKVLGVGLGDSQMDCLAAWGDPARNEQSHTAVHINLVSWHYKGYDIQLEVWDSDGRSEHFGTYKKGTVRHIAVGKTE